MCMLSYFPPGIMPKESHLSNGADANPDGHGFAIVTGRAGSQQITTFKSMDRDEAITRFLDIRRKDKNGPALFHSRIATSGLVDVTGCHPYRVGTDPRTVIGHNGVLFSPAGNRSDTRIFAEDILPRMGNLDRGNKFRKIEEFCRGNKLCVLTVNPRYRRNAYLINGKLGVWTDGAWHSNNDWKDYAKYYKGSHYKVYWPYGADENYGAKYVGESAIPGTEPWPCNLCGARDTVSSYTMICDMCLSCNDCEQHRDVCMCYYARRTHRDDWEAPTEPARTVARKAEPGIVRGSLVPAQERLALPVGTGGGWDMNS